MKNTSKTVIVLRTPCDELSVCTNMTEVYKTLENWNERYKDANDCLWSNMPTYAQMLKRKKEQLAEGYLYSESLSDVNTFDPLMNVEIKETYLNRR